MSAQAVYDKLTSAAVATVPEDAKGGAIIDLIIQLLPTLLPILIGCFAPPKAVEVAHNPGPFHQAVLDLHIYREMPDRATYRQLGPTIKKAVLAAGKALTETDIAELNS